MSDRASNRSKFAAPPWRQLLGEFRVLPELAQYWLHPKAEAVPQGQGQPILLVPGYGAGGGYLRPLQRRLAAAGFAAEDWEQGINLGMTGKVKAALADRVQQLHDRDACKVALVGWSLGGVFVREMARHQPDLVSHVFALGSPISHDPNGNNLATLFNLMNPGKEVDADMAAFRRREQAPPVPCTAIYSKTDGIVNWRCAQELAAPNTENVCVSGTHFGLPMNEAVAQIIAQRVQQVQSRK